MTILSVTLPSNPASSASFGYSLLGISTSIGSGCTVRAVAWATGPMSSAAGAAARAPGFPYRLLPTGAENPPLVLVEDIEIPRCTGPGVAAGAFVGGGVSGGGVSGGGVFVGGGGLFSATRRAGRSLSGSAGLGGSGGGGALGSTGFTVSTIWTSTFSLRCGCAGSCQAQPKTPRC